MEKRYSDIVEKIDETMLFIHNEFPNAEFLYSKILPRAWWGYHACTLARWIDYYILCKLRKTYHVREIWARDVFTQHYQFDECVDHGMLQTDQTHLSYNGNKALISGIMKPLLNKWKNNVSQ